MKKFIITEEERKNILNQYKNLLEQNFNPLTDLANRVTTGLEDAAAPEKFKQSFKKKFPCINIDAKDQNKKNVYTVAKDKKNNFYIKSPNKNYYINGKLYNKNTNRTEDFSCDTKGKKLPPGAAPVYITKNPQEFTSTRGNIVKIPSKTHVFLVGGVLQFSDSPLVYVCPTNKTNGHYKIGADKAKDKNTKNHLENMIKGFCPKQKKEEKKSNKIKFPNLTDEEICRLPNDKKYTYTKQGDKWYTSTDGVNWILLILPKFQAAVDILNKDAVCGNKEGQSPNEPPSDLEDFPLN